MQRDTDSLGHYGSSHDDLNQQPESAGNATPPSPRSTVNSFEAPYDPPVSSYDGGDIAMQHTENTLPSIHVESPIFSKKDYSFVSGQANDSDTRSLISTAKRYDHHESRRFLLKAGAYRFLITLGLSILIGISLKAYEGFREPYVMSKNQVRIFNSIMLGLSLALGLNLASSLKRYAVILRWYLLTRRYVSLEVFDLILGLDALTKVGKLMIISLPGIRNVKLFRKLPWFREARDDGTRFTWIVCAIWILINIGAQILVAALSLFWPVDPSVAVPLMMNGNVTTARLDTWSLPILKDTEDEWANTTGMEAAWSAGIEAMVYREFPLNESHADLSLLPGMPLYRGDGFYEYRFYNRDPEHEYTNYVISKRSIRAHANCQKLEIMEGDWDLGTGTYMIKAKEDGKDWGYYEVPETAEGSFTWSASVLAYCGPRCTNFTVYQHNDRKKITSPSLFLCESHLDTLNYDPNEFAHLSDDEKLQINGTDEWARLAAGSISWTGFAEGVQYRQTRSYLAGSKWSPPKMLEAVDVENLLARFTIGAVAAWDDHGERAIVKDQAIRPVQGQQLQVDWGWVLGLLGGICLIQFAALCCLLAFGNKSVIRDESAFSLAMFLSPVVSKIGKAGMNLSGDEIKQHPKLLWRRIKYGYRQGKDGEPNVVDILWHGRDPNDIRRSWEPGLYS